MTALNEQIGGNHVEYCQNCTDINEGIFVRKCDCQRILTMRSKDDRDYLIYLENRISELETQVYKLNEKYSNFNKNDRPESILEQAKKNAELYEKFLIAAFKTKEITDTERLDFIDKENLEVWRYRENWKSKIINETREYEAETARKAIDAAMRGKDGK